MKKSYRVMSLGVMGCLVLLAFGSVATATNITIWDGSGTGTGWYGGDEDQEVERPAHPQEAFDLEAMILSADGQSLTIIGQWDFLNGAEGYKSGDLFIDVDNNALYGSSLIPGPYGYSQAANSLFNYDYVIDVDWDGGTLNSSVWGLNGYSMVTTVKFSSTTESNPWRYDSYGIPTDIQSANVVLQTLTAGQVLSDYGVAVLGETGANHYTATFDISWLPSVDGSLFHFTEGCGNDNIVGKAASVPDGGMTVMLLGLALGALGMYSRGRVIR